MTNEEQPTKEENEKAFADLLVTARLKMASEMAFQIYVDRVRRLAIYDGDDSSKRLSDEANFAFEAASVFYETREVWITP